MANGDKFQTTAEAFQEARSISRELHAAFDTLHRARKRAITAWKRTGACPTKSITELEGMLTIADTSYKLALDRMTELERECIASTRKPVK